MTEILLTSEVFVRNVMNISDNLAGKFLLPAIREAQEGPLRSILGDCLTDRLKELAAAGAIAAEGHEAYRALVDKAQYFLAYTAVVDVIMKVSYKIDNFGLSRTTDENQTFATFDEVVKNRYYYQAKADGYALDLQRWIIARADAFPELDGCDCSRLRSNLKSAATCGVWLGGPRGKGSQGGGCTR